jgi:DNA-nicking Smr family endonuclease
MKTPKVAASRRVPPRDETSDDAQAFESAMAGVSRLESDPRGRVRATRLITARTAEDASDHDDAGSDTAFAAAGVDRRELRKLKREYVAGSRLDLHGMKASEACASVGRFIDSSRHRRLRCVCIIHGRGLHSEGQSSILKPRVRAYLRSHRAVLAFTDAPRSDGGTGAVYVLLRQEGSPKRAPAVSK